MSNLLVLKLRRDLQATWSRITMMIIAITVSLIVFSSVLYAWSTTSRETKSAYVDTNPASATILLDRPIDEAKMATLIEEVRRQSGVIDATARTQFNTDVTLNGRALDVPLQIFAAAPNDPMRIAKVNQKSGTWPPPRGELFVGSDTLALTGLQLGDDINVIGPGGVPLSLRVSGVVYDPSLAPAPQEQRGHGYISTTSLTASGASAPLDQLKLQIGDRPGASEASRDRDTIVRSASDVAAWLASERGVAVREVQVPPPYEHPHQGQSDALLLSLLAGGAAALLLSTILVATMLNGLFVQQIPQIGIMKAIGARANRIALMYLAMILLVATAATALAFVPGLALGRIGASAVLGFLGIEPQTLAPPLWTYAAVVVAGVLLPPAMTLVPLIRTSRTTVRAAIDHHGAGVEGRGASMLLALLGRVRGFDRGLLMALRNIVRRPARFVLSVGLLATAGTVFIAGMSLGDGVSAIAAESKAQRVWDVDVQLAQTISAEKAREIATGVSGVTAVEGWAMLKSGVAGPRQIPVTRTYPDQGHGGVGVTALPADSAVFSTPEIADGRWLRPGETGAVVLNQVTVAKTVPGIGAGDSVDLVVGGRSTTWTVVGIANERGANGAAYVTQEGLAKALDQVDSINSLRVVTSSHDEVSRIAVAAAVRESFEKAGIEVVSSESVSVRDEAAEGHLGPIIMILVAIAVAMAVVGCIGLASTMSTNVLERTREFGVMHAIGAQPKAVRRVVTAEGIFLALASCMAAIIPTLVLTRLMGMGLGNLFMYAPLPFRVSPIAIAIWIAVVCLGAVLATEAAASRASRLTVREALSYL